MRALWRDEAGASAIQYGVFAAIIGLGIAGTLVATKSSLNSNLSCISSKIATESGTTCVNGAVTTPPVNTTEQPNAATPTTGLPPAAAAAQAVMPTGSTIQNNGVFKDKAGNTYSATISGALMPGQPVYATLRNNGTGASLSGYVNYNALGYYDANPAYFTAIGPGLDGISNADGSQNVIYAVLNKTSNTYDLYLVKPPQ